MPRKAVLGRPTFGRRRLSNALYIYTSICVNLLDEASVVVPGRLKA